MLLQTLCRAVKFAVANARVETMSGMSDSIHSSEDAESSDQEASDPEGSSTEA